MHDGNITHAYSYMYIYNVMNCSAMYSEGVYSLGISLGNCEKLAAAQD